MVNVLQIVMFLVAFSVFSLMMYYYPLFRIVRFFSMRKKRYIYLISVLLTLGVFFTTFLTRVWPSLITRILHFVSTTIIGVFFFLFSVLLVYEVLNFFFKFEKVKSGIVILVIVGVMTVYSLVNGMFLVVNEIDIPVENLTGDLRIVQVSDVHLGTLTSGAYLERIVDKVNGLDPDLVVITGDLFDGTSALRQENFDSLDRLTCRVLFVTGNHETYEGVERIKEILGKTKVEVLENEVLDFEGVEFVGIGYPDSFEAMRVGPYLVEKLRGVERNNSLPSVLLYHAPVDARVLKENNISLQLSGHTHNGQIFPFSLLVLLANPYGVGLHCDGGSCVYVSSGSGMWGPQMRLGSRNEIVVVDLVGS